MLTHRDRLAWHSRAETGAHAAPQVPPALSVMPDKQRAAALPASVPVIVAG